MVEIAKAFLTEVRLLILDEPTASLTEAETQNLFALVGRLKAPASASSMSRTACRRFQKIADRITVLRDGRKITTVKSGDVSESELVELMTGRKVGVLFPPSIIGRPQKLLEVEDVTLVRSFGKECELLRARRRDHRHRRPCRLRQIGNRARRLRTGGDRRRAPSA